MVSRASDEPLLTVDDVKDLFGVARNTVLNWVDAELMDCERLEDGTIAFRRSAVICAKVMRESDVLRRDELTKLEVDETDLARAKLEGVVQPSEGRDGRYSLEDVEKLAAWKRGEWPPQRSGSAAEQAPSRESGRDRAGDEITGIRRAMPADEISTIELANGWASMRAYLRTGDVTKLRAFFRACPQCPLFLAPIGVFRIIYFGSFVEHGTPYTRLKRSAGFLKDYGRVIYVPEMVGEGAQDVLVTMGTCPCGSPSLAHALGNVQYEQAKRAWENFWLECHHEVRRERGLPLVTFPDEETSERRDPLAVQQRFHQENLSVLDLEDWYLLSPFGEQHLPRANLFRYRFGRAHIAPNGLWVTPIERSDGWEAASPDKVPQWVPANPFFSFAWGIAPEGGTPPWLEEENRRFDVDREAWQEERRLRERRRERDSKLAAPRRLLRAV